jgi:hypothetical protein
VISRDEVGRREEETEQRLGAWCRECEGEPLSDICLC